MLEMLDKSAVLTLILLTLCNLICAMIYVYENNNKKERDKYWKKQYEKAAQNYFESAAEECTVTEEFTLWENCDDDCYMCDYESKCKQSLANKE